MDNHFRHSRPLNRKMKRTLIIAAAILALASCTKVDKAQEEDSLLTFKVLGYLQQTKANTPYTGSAFGTFAYWTATDWATDGDAFVYMNNDRVVQSPSYAQEGEWGPESQRYWPKTGKLSFASYSPYTDGAAHGFSAVPGFSKASGFVFADFTIGAGTDVDLMVADFNADQTKNNPEYMLSGNTDGVPTLFRHVLSQIAFKFRTLENPNPNVEKSEIVIKRVVISGIYNSATYTQNNTPVWAGQSGNASYEYNPATGHDVVVVAGEEPAGCEVASRILMPQRLTAGTQTLELDYTVRTKYFSSPDWAEESVTAVKDLLTGEVPSWDPNINLVYTITINPISTESILFDPAVAEWISTSGSLEI